MDDKFRSRRYLITLLVITGTLILGYLKVMSGGDVALVLTGAITSFNMKDSFKK